MTLMSAPPCRRLVAAGAILVAVATALLLPWAPTPASGHAGGPLPHARLAAEGPIVTIEWTAAPDDTADVGIAIGLLPEEAMEAYLDVASEYLPTDDEIERLSRSAELRDYLVDNIQVRQDGQRCPGEAEPADNFIMDGATLTFRCPEPVEQVDVRVTMLHDQDPAYRTFSVDGTVQFAVHTSSAPEQTWDFTLVSDQEERRSLPVALIVVGLALVAGGAIVSLGSIRARRRHPRARRARS